MRSSKTCKVRGFELTSTAINSIQPVSTSHSNKICNGNQVLRANSYVTSFTLYSNKVIPSMLLHINSFNNLQITAYSSILCIHKQTKENNCIL